MRRDPVVHFPLQCITEEQKSVAPAQNSILGLPIPRHRLKQQPPQNLPQHKHRPLRPLTRQSNANGIVRKLQPRSQLHKPLCQILIGHGDMRESSANHASGCCFFKENGDERGSSTEHPLPL